MTNRGLQLAQAAVPPEIQTLLSKAAPIGVLGSLAPGDLSGMACLMICYLLDALPADIVTNSAMGIGQIVRSRLPRATVTASGEATVRTLAAARQSLLVAVPDGSLRPDETWALVTQAISRGVRCVLYIPPDHAVPMDSMTSYADGWFITTRPPRLR